MKKSFSIILVILMVICTFSLLTFFGCKTEAAETTTAAETEAAETTTAAETEAAEDMNEPDPWILEMREGWENFDFEKFSYLTGPDEVPQTFQDELILTKGEVEKLRAGKEDGTPFTYAMCWHYIPGDYGAAQIDAIEKTAEYLGIKLIAETNADFDPIKLKSDIETVTGLKPDAIISTPIDPVTEKETYKIAVNAGIKISFLDFAPFDTINGVDYYGVSANLPYALGVMAGRVLGDAGVKNLGIVFYEQINFTLNQMDDAVRDTITNEYPDTKIIDEQGFDLVSDAFNSSAAIMQRNPDVDSFYTTWFEPAMQIVEACSTEGRSDIKISCVQADTPSLIDMVKGGNMYGMSTDSTWNMGQNVMLLAAYALLGKETPAYVTCPASVYTLDNIREQWDLSMHLPMPADLDEALKEAGL